MTTTPSGPEAIILTEAGHGRGLGHLGRCTALAEALEECGARPRLFVRGIDRVPEELAAGGAAEAVEWLDELPAALAGCGIAIVDSYEAPAQLYARVAEAARIGIWLDDTRRLDYPSGLVVDSGVRAAVMGGERIPPGTVLLFGPRFQPLRRPFWTLTPRRLRNDVERILVVMGGTDSRDLAPRVAAALSAAYPSARLDLVGGDRSAQAMAKAMAAAEICVTAAGQTLFELAAAGVPSVGIVAADNQRSNAEGWADAGFLRLAGTWSDSDLERTVVEAVGECWSRDARERSSRAGRALCDGRGALRVAERAVSAWRASWLSVRPAGITDEAALRAVSNDPQVRAASFQSGQIAASEHRTWLEKRLKDPDSVLFVVEDASVVVGVIRFAVERASAAVGIALAPRVRGRGLAVPLLERGLAGLVAARPDVTWAIALVRTENDVSRALFAAAGFTEEERGFTEEERVEPGVATSVRFARAL